MRNDGERGSVLVEFALVSLALYLLLAATIDFGRLMFSAQGVQDVARLAARELAVVPLPANITFEDALAQPAVLERIFNPACLVVNLDDFASDAELEAFFARMPVVNKALRPLMIADRSTGQNLVRYPGALLRNNNPAANCGRGGSGTPFTVGIPRVVGPRGVNGVETIEWVPILEEIRSDPADPTTGPFSLAGALPQRGLVAVRINYPYQAATMSAFQESAAGPFEPNLNRSIAADDSFVAPAPPGGTLRPEPDPDEDVFQGPYAGRYGLGRLASPLGNGQGVRPFRKLLAAQAIYRREVFQ